MQVEVTITVKGIKAESYDEAKEIAYWACDKMLLYGLRIAMLDLFVRAVSCYKNVDGTFTVTLL